MPNPPIMSASASRTSVFLLLISIVLLAGCETPVVEPLDVWHVKLDEGEYIKADRVVLLFDASGSIDERSEYPEAKALLESFANAMPEGSYDVGVIAFGGSEREQLAMAKHTPGQLSEHVSSTRFLGEETPLPEVFDEARGMVAGTDGHTAVVLFSDGVATRFGKQRPAEATIESAQALIASQRGEVCIHAVQIGDDPAGTLLLQDLTNLTSCGSHTAASKIKHNSNLYVVEYDVFVGRELPSVAAAPPVDTDGDGVADANDRCPATRKGVEVDSIGCRILTDLNYAFDSAEIPAEKRAELDEIIEILRGNPELQIRIDGHTDSMGPEVYNLWLSEQRAQGVRDFLSNAGVDPKRLVTEGHGELQPIADNDTVAGRRKNRRSALSLIE